MVTSEQIKNWIESGLIDAEVKISGDGHHFEGIVISDQFEHKNTLQRHRMVYATLGERMGGEIHALSLQTFTKKEYNNQK